jgi:hypothetical protein
MTGAGPRISRDNRHRLMNGLDKCSTDIWTTPSHSSPSVLPSFAMATTYQSPGQNCFAPLRRSRMSRLKVCSTIRRDRIHKFAAFFRARNLMDGRWCFSRNWHRQRRASNWPPQADYHCTAQFSQEAGAMAQSPCPTCAGSGKCPGCDGLGLLADENRPAAQPSGADRTCPGCGGSGKCPTCKGSGLTGPSSSET